MKRIPSWRSGRPSRWTPAEVWIWGALGHRVDHILANISLLVQGSKRGIEVKLIDAWCEVFLIDRRTVLEGEAGQTVSLLPFGGAASGVTLTGFEYPLTKARHGDRAALTGSATA